VGKRSKEAMSINIEKRVWTLIGKSNENNGVEIMSWRVLISAQRNWREVPLK
jgi:hypothetical protein